MSLSKRLISTDAAGAADGSAYFDTVLWTGNSGVQSISSLSFAPDFVWVKKRNSATSGDHMFMDTIRGIGSGGGANILYPSYDLAESTNADANYFRSFDSNGFTMGSNTYFNASPNTYVGWCWKAGGSAVSNTNGTITSTVSANAAAGFSIVKYSGNSTAGATVGHGLTSPQMVIIKCTSTNSTNWILYADALGNSNYLTPNQNVGEATFTNWFFSNATTFTLNQTFGNANTSSRDYIAYCFSDVAGYQKIGSYNGSSSAVTVTTGFNPRWVLIKRSNLTNKDWVMFDQARSGGNDMNDFLVVNTSAAEFENATDTKINGLSDGFSVNAGMWDGVNASGGEYFYWAIA